MDKTQNLNRSQANRFWKDFNRLFKPPPDQMVEALMNKDGTIITENEDIEAEMFKTFFEARHIEENSSKFNDQFYNEVNSLYEEIKNGNFQPNPDCRDSFKDASALYNPITEWEIMTVIKNIKSPASSFDNCEFHPSMLKHLESNAINALSRLFSLCLRNGNWIWNESNVIFLKKDGKPSYSIPGAYRPISISSYIGKLMERILAHRLEKYLTKIGLTDDNQEGFSKGRNTIRYLHRLTAGIKGDISKKLTVLCLFIDFEKAFDSVWKKGLVVKLWKVGVHGCYLKTIDSFLFGRTVSLLINGFVGPRRECLDYGLPQGSVLSPILFKFFIYDIESICQLYEQIKVFKFADDGTVKVTGEDLEECLFFLNLAMGSISNWTSCWRMVINCDPNKTEVLCLNTYEQGNVPKTFLIGDKEIQLTEKTKVLGIILDRKLNYKDHSKYIHDKLIYRWVCMSRYTNRNWGMNQSVTVRIAKTLFFSSLFYGSIVWMKNSNMTDINSLWYKVSKAATGAVFNVSSVILEVILGVPPLRVSARVVAIKHYLKVFSDPQDIHQMFVLHQLEEGNSTVLYQLRDTLKFLQWKAKYFSNTMENSDLAIIAKKDISLIQNLSAETCKYTKGMVELFTEELWQESITTQMTIEGWPTAPKVSCSPIPIPFGVKRDSEVLLMSLLYNQNLLNSFLFHLDRQRWDSPLCICKKEEQDALHLLTNCDKVGSQIGEMIIELMKFCNNTVSEIAATSNPFSILNCSRDPKFIELSLEVVEMDCLKLRKKINLHKKKQ